MRTKLIKTVDGYELFKQGFLKGSTNHELIDSLNIEEGNIRYKLSLKNCQAIELGYDLDELASERLSTRFDENSGYHKFVFVEAYKEGFQKALEILGDKKFSEEDINNAMNWIMTQYFEFNEQPTTGKREHYIQSLQQTEWDVDILEECLDKNCDGINKKGECITTGKPKIDEDGYLILKRI